MRYIEFFWCFVLAALAMCALMFWCAITGELFWMPTQCISAYVAAHFADDAWSRRHDD